MGFSVVVVLYSYIVVYVGCYVRFRGVCKFAIGKRIIVMFPGGRFEGRVPIEIDAQPICTTISQRRLGILP